MNLVLITLITWAAPSAKDAGLQPPSIVSQSLQTGTVKRDNQEFVIEDTSWREPIPNVGGVTGDRAYLRQMTSLLGKVTSESVRTEGSLPAVSLKSSALGRSAWEDLVLAWPLNSSDAKERLIADSGASADISAQPKVTIYDESGKLVEELNLAGSLKAQRQLVPLLNSLQTVALTRSPAELRSGMKVGTWDIPKGRSSRSLRSIVELMRTNSRLEITVDDRVANRLVTTNSEGLSIKWRELAERLPRVLNLSWIQKGNVYHLVAAEGEPLGEKPETFDSLVVEVLTHLQELGVIDATVPAAQIVGARSDLGAASESVTNAIAGAYSECGKDAGKFRQVLEEARQKRGYRLSYEYAISSTYNGPGFSFTTFVNSR